MLVIAQFLSLTCMSSQKGEFFIIAGLAHDYLCMSTVLLLEETRENLGSYMHYPLFML